MLRFSNLHVQISRIIQKPNKSHKNHIIQIVPCKTAIRKAIVKSSRLKNKANRSKNPVDIVNYKKQRNLVANLIENDRMLLKNEEVAKEFNQYFGHITDSLDLYEFPDEKVCE